MDGKAQALQWLRNDESREKRLEPTPVNHARNTPVKQIASIAVAAAMAAMVCSSALAVAPACAAQAGKHPVPRVSKLISHDGEAFAERIDVEAGDTVRYRVSASMPENAGNLKTLVFEIGDVPDADVRIDVGSAKAFLVDASGDTVAGIACDAKRKASGSVTFALGDLKAAYPGLSYGHEAVVEYDATIAHDAKSGEHPNCAKLIYDDGSGKRETVGAMALAVVAAAGSKEAGSAGVGGTSQVGDLPGTGDSLAILPAFAAAAMALAAACAVLAWVRAKAPDKGIGQKGRLGEKGPK